MTLGIQFGGLASGLDTGAIIDAILAAEGRPIRVLEKRKGDEQQKLSLLGTFEGLVKKLRDQARDLQDGSNFFAHKLSVGTEGIASFTLSGSAEASAHELEVLALASADRYAFAGVTDPTADLTPGTLSFTYKGTAHTINVTAGSDLNDLAAAINSAAGDDVTASVVNVGTSASPSHQLVIAGDDTGEDFTITGLTTTVTQLGTATRVSTATNASATIDGLAVERSSNLFSDVLPGVSFSVTRLTEVGTPLTFTVGLDPDGIKKNLQEFVDAYNAVVDFIEKQNEFSIDDGPGGPLFGDSALDSIRSSLQRALFVPDETVFASNPNFGSMGSIGLELESDGHLKINSNRLDERLNSDLDAFEQFFNRADDTGTTTVDERGVFVRLEERLDDLLDNQVGLNGQSIEGLFQARRTAVNRQVKTFDDDIDRLEFRLDQLEESLVQKFAALEQLLGGLQTQQAFLSSGLGLSGGRR
jgi:flagellar hook-associated protein 2